MASEKQMWINVLVVKKTLSVGSGHDKDALYITGRSIKNTLFSQHRLVNIKPDFTKYHLFIDSFKYF